MCDCEDRPCCSCDKDYLNPYEPDPIDAYRESLEMDWDEDEDENEDTETFIHHEDKDFLTD